jgi:hypothetical protein
VNTAPIPLRVVHGDPQSRWEAEVAEELATPFDPRHAPLVRAVLIHATDNAAFTLVAHHAIADGMSLAYAVRDTLRALSGAVLEPLPSTPSLEEMLWVDGAASGLIVADGRQPEALPGNPGIYRPRDKARPQVRGLCLTPTLTASLRDRARQETTTVHGALCAAATSSPLPTTRRRWEVSASTLARVCPEATSVFACRASSQKSVTPRSNTLDAALIPLIASSSPFRGVWLVYVKQSDPSTVAAPIVCSSSKPASTHGPHSALSHRILWR